MLIAAEKGAELIVSVGSQFNLVEFLDKSRRGMSSTFLTRLRIGEILVDAKGVSRLYRPRPGNASSGSSPGSGWSRSPRSSLLTPGLRRRRRPAVAQAPAAAGDRRLTEPMFDFRYHALSLVAVFVALTVGLLLGVAIGDQGLVSSAEKQLRDDLRGDLQEARAEAADLRTELAQRRRYEDADVPRRSSPAAQAPAGRCSCSWTSAPTRSSRHVRDAVGQSGGELVFSGDRAAPARPGGARRCCRREPATSRSPTTPASSTTSATRHGRPARSGRPAGAAAAALLLFTSTSGELEAVESVVVVRTPGNVRRRRRSRSSPNAFVEGMLSGLARFKTPVVGVETSDHRPVPDRLVPAITTWQRRQHRRASPGAVSLVYALAGSADGAYGDKTTADALLPDALAP